MSTLLRFAITPIFFLLGFVNYSLESGAGGHVGHMSHAAAMGASGDAMGMMSSVSIFGFSLSGSTAALLTSMWLMYLLMGFAHISPWLDFFGGKRAKDF